MNLQPRHVPWLGIKPATLVHETMLQPMSHLNSHGYQIIIMCDGSWEVAGKKWRVFSLG